MRRHQIITTDASQFPSARPVAEQQDLNWFLCQLGSGWVMINSEYGYVELIDNQTLTQAQAEASVFQIIRRHSLGDHLERHIGLSADYVSWAVTDKLPSFVAHRYAEVKSLFDELGSLDGAWFRVQQLNQRDVLGLDDYSPEQWLRWYIDKECAPDTKPSIFGRLWNTLFDRRPWQR